MVKKEMNVVQHVAKELGYNSIVFDHLLKMISAQDEFASPPPQQKTAQQQNTYQHTTQQKTEQPKAEQSKTQQNKYEEPKKEQAKNSSNNNFYNQPKYRNPALEDAYQALGVNSGMTEQEIRRAYQKLVSQFHPDKLVGQGMPPDLVNAATERFKKIQAAYDFLKNYRSIYSAA